MNPDVIYNPQNLRFKTLKLGRLVKYLVKNSPTYFPGGYKKQLWRSVGLDFSCWCAKAQLEEASWSLQGIGELVWEKKAKFGEHQLGWLNVLG